LRGEETLVAAESARPLSPLLSESTDRRSGAKRGSVVDEADAHSVSALLALNVLLNEGAGDGDGDEALGFGAGGGLERCRWSGDTRRGVHGDMSLAVLGAPLGPLRECFVACGSGSEDT
jgi:hypothetical protein